MRLTSAFSGARRAAEIDPECEELNLVTQEIKGLVEKANQQDLSGKDDAALRPYSLEEQYRELMRPASGEDQSRELLRAFLLVENIEDLVQVVRQYPYLLDETLLRSLETIGNESQNLPIRAMI